MTAAVRDSSDHGPTRLQRGVVVAALALLLVPGLIGFDAWPLTGWRLFSLARTDRQTRWVVETLDANDVATPFSLEQLPMRYRNAEWPLSDLGHALRPPTRGRLPGPAGRRAGRPQPRRDTSPPIPWRASRSCGTTRQLVHRADRWVVLHHRTVLHRCTGGVRRVTLAHPSGRATGRRGALRAGDGSPPPRRPRAAVDPHRHPDRVRPVPPAGPPSARPVRPGADPGLPAEHAAVWPSSPACR